MATVTRAGFRLVLAASLLALLVVLLGAYTRLSHAGLGCPDWPGCYGFPGVPMSESQQALAGARFPDAPLDVARGWIEMVHRYFAGLLGLLVLAVAVQALRRRALPGQPLRLPLLLLALVILQAAFGMWTVTLRLWPQVVTAHLLGGFATLSLLVLLGLRLSGRVARCAAPPGLRGLAAAGLALLVVQIALGGWVSSNYAALACVDLPTCHGVWWPPSDFANGFHLTQQIGPNYLGGQLDNAARTAIHLGHRLGALAVAALLLALAVRLWRAGLPRLAGLLLAMLLLQLGLGVANVLLHLPLGVALAHHLGAALLLQVLVLINYRLRGTAAQRSAPASAADGVAGGADGCPTGIARPHGIR